MLFVTDDIHKNDVPNSTEFSYGFAMHFCHVIDGIQLAPLVMFIGLFIGVSLVGKLDILDAINIVLINCKVILSV